MHSTPKLHKVNRFGCSGGLIGSRHVLTAGHCFDSVFDMKADKFGMAKIGSVVIVSLSLSVVCPSTLFSPDMPLDMLSAMDLSGLCLQ